jgi:hypothetical protein
VCSRNFFFFFFVGKGVIDAFQSGDGPDILLTEEGKPLTELKDRWKVTEKMLMIPQYAFAGDFTGMSPSVHASFVLIECM